MFDSDKCDICGKRTENLIRYRIGKLCQQCWFDQKTGGRGDKAPETSASQGGAGNEPGR
ncbi:MAG TPA: hypothetical protein PKL48_01595 [Thermodesulfobacteriota bacterium]|nr:hypothetical protein [Thermodesulfobacteriota bacterium]